MIVELARNQHNGGRKHQEQVRLYYTAFLKTNKQVGDPISHLFISIPNAKLALNQQISNDIISRVQPNIIAGLIKTY